MSQHVEEEGVRKYVYGWDQPLMSFFLQIHDLALPEDEQIIAWYGADENSKMYEVEDLVKVARHHGLDIPAAKRSQLYGEKDDGR